MQGGADSTSPDRQLWLAEQNAALVRRLEALEQDKLRAEAQAQAERAARQLLEERTARQLLEERTARQQLEERTARQQLEERTARQMEQVQ